MWRKTQDEPVVLTLSSDDEDNSEDLVQIKNNSTNQNSALDLTPAVYQPLNPKEPIIKPNESYGDWHFYHQNYEGLKMIECNKQFNIQNSDVFVSFQCQSVRIGSYKFVPNEKISLSKEGIVVIVPPIDKDKRDPIRLKFPLEGIRKILAHFGPGNPVLYVYVTDPLAKTVRDDLGMFDENGFYFDPCSNEESQKRLTISPERLQEDSITIIRNIFKFKLKNEKDESEEPLQFMEELCQKDASEILIRSSPFESESFDKSIDITPRDEGPDETETFLVFPPPPQKGGITITRGDYLCLKEETFLNDVLVDFYMKWLHSCHISEKDRERTHIFSTFFYKRLTAKPKSKFRPSLSEVDPNLSAAERRHARVQSWTKTVDIFSKDFILIPINEQSHWFLAVICFPNLNGPEYTSTGKPVPISEATLPTRSSTRKKKKIEIPVIDDCDGSDRDEAEGDDFEMEDDDEIDEATDQSNVVKQKKAKEDTVKQPCILILDSLSGSSRSRIVSTLRDYLTVEYSKRKKKTKVFDKESMMGACPKVPQQNNYSDCGIFLLQFAQSFFDTPLKDFRLPIRSLQNWFSQDVASKKRESVGELIKTLMNEHRPRHGIEFPALTECPDNKSDDQPQTQLEEEAMDQQENSLVHPSKISLLRKYRIESPHDNYKNILNESDLNLSNNSSTQNNSNSNTSDKKYNNSLSNLKNPEIKQNTLDNYRIPKISPFKSMLTDNDNTRKYQSRKSFVGNNAKANKPLNSSLQLLCDSYTNDTEEDLSDMEDEDAIFLTNKSKRFKMSPVES